ncbi:MAG: hypothetical protein JSV32_00030, partial [Dehalococcoidia bacterium]
YIASLMDLGKQTESKCIVIPTSDGAVMALSKHKAELEQYFILPFPDFDIVEKLVNKRMFYQLMEQMSVPYPKTYFPEDLNELKTIGKEIEYPYIIKPAYMHMFLAKFHVKCLYVDSLQMLDDAIQELEGKELDVFLQEIIPGDDHYSLLTYFDSKSEPHAFCGWDKIQQDPPFFGNYSVLCKSIWRGEPIALAEKVLRMMKYYGIAEPEFKKDTRDNTYKLLEINARTSIPNALAAKCGTDITHIAYLDKTGRDDVNTDPPENDILWVNDIFYFRNFMRLKFIQNYRLMDIINPFKKKRVYAIAAWDDPIPLFSALSGLGYRSIKKIFRKSAP